MTTAAARPELEGRRMETAQACEDVVELPPFQRALIVTRLPPNSTHSGDGIYSAQLMGTVRKLAQTTKILCCASPNATNSEIDGLTVSTLVPGRWSLARYVLSLDTKAGATMNTDKNRRSLMDILTRNLPDLVVIDHIDQSWILPIVRKYRKRFNPTAILVYMTHNHETASRLSIARRSGFPRSMLYVVDALRANIRDKQMIKNAEVVTCICDRDRNAYRKAGHANVVLLEPTYQGPARLSRVITAATPRRVTVIGSFLWSAKRMNLFAFLETAKAQLVPAGIGVDIVGQMRESDLAQLRRAFPEINFTGEVEAVDPYLDRSRLALLIDQSGGGFKLTLLTYAFRRAPIAAISSNVPSAEWGGYCITAADLDTLADAICSQIDDIAALNDMQNRMFEFASRRVGRTCDGEGLRHALRAATLEAELNSYPGGTR